MNKFLNYVPINISALYFGVQNDYISCPQAEKFIYENNNFFLLTESQLIEIFNFREDKAEFIMFLDDNFKINLDYQLRLWQWIIAKSIVESELTEYEKINELNIQWARFDYPESWISFFFCYPQTTYSIGINGVYQFVKSEEDFLTTIFNFKKSS
jgi:hypothetical protein